ncbi:hypothetical protein [Winogradskyella wichelsiae]|uniref:hypothetical protein n=1 Tax=Winogradskyella wichelsiae TaxID=2697007 RepID=UPI0015CC7718|nr:hypothetical protein [Winogradskyella wichelsiae]
MKKFILRIVVYFSIAFFFISLFQIFISLKIENEIITGHDNFKTTSNVNSELVLLGSSRCFSHFDPAFFQTNFNLKSTNIGVDGHSQISMAYFRLVDYLKHNNNPKFAILNFDPFMTPGSFTKNGGNLVHKDAFARYAFLPLNEKWKTVEHFDYNILEKYLPLYSLFKYNQLEYSFFPNNSNYEKYGFNRNDLEWKNEKPDTLVNFKSKYSINRHKNEIKKALKFLYEFCDSNGIKLICIQSPVHESIYYENIFETPQQICSDLNIPYIDANYKSIRKDSNNFYNSNHMNINGIHLMNEKLKKEKVLIQLFTE